MTRARPFLLALAALLLAGGAVAYAGFTLHVLDRGDRVVHEAWGSSSARTPLLLAGAGIAAFAAAGGLGLAALRASRWRPVGSLGFPAALAAAVGLLAFAAGPGAFAAAASILVCFVAAALGASFLGGPAPLWRVALRSWLAVGTLLALAAVAVGALGVLEKQLPRVPWAALLAAGALATLMGTLGRHVARHGRDPEAAARPHAQVRTALDDEAIRSVAGRLHPFLEEGRGGAEYDLLLAELAGRAGGTPPPRPLPLPGPSLPARPAGLAAFLRAAAFAAPPAFLLPGPWALALPLATLGLLLPPARAALLPRREPLPAAWWLAGSLLAAVGAVLALRLVIGDDLLAAAGVAAGLPYAGLALWAGSRPLAEEAAFLRAAKARAMAAQRTAQAARGALAAAAFLALPVAFAGLPLLLGVAMPEVPLPLVGAGALGGALWAAAALVAGTAAGRSLEAMEGAHAQQAEARRAAHRTFLESLEAT